MLARNDDMVGEDGVFGELARRVLVEFRHELRPFSEFPSVRLQELLKLVRLFLGGGHMKR